jgi:hypothetical protein
MIRGVPRLREVVIGLALLLGLGSSTGCLTPSPRAWDAALTPGARAEVLEKLPEAARDSLLPLSEIFYGRITSRRFNSRATFEDPSVRELFPTLASFSDYYAALVDALESAYIEYNRPTRVELVGIEFDEQGSLWLSIRYTGRNDLPLRWWNATLLRADEWRWRDGRWWIVPGKV